MLVVHRAERADHLVAALGDVLASPLDNPMVPEIISVPTRGVERWLGQRLSTRLGTGAGRADGVSANVAFPFPGSLVAAATAAVCGIDPDDDPWPPERSVWPLLEIVDGNLGEPFLAALRRHLEALAGGPGAPIRRFAAVRRIADLSTATRWTGPTCLRPGRPERPVGGPAVTTTRRGRRSCGGGSAPASTSPDRRSGTSRRRRGLRKMPLRGLAAEVVDLGLTRLPASHLSVLRALAAARDVHLFLLHPSPSLWPRWRRNDLGPMAIGRSDHTTAGFVVNPLLRSWGPRQPARCSSCSPPRASGLTSSGRKGGAVRTVLGLDPARHPPRFPAPRHRSAGGTSRACRGRRQSPDPRLPRPPTSGRGHARCGPAPVGGRRDPSLAMW